MTTAASNGKLNRSEQMKAYWAKKRAEDILGPPPEEEEPEVPPEPEPEPRPRPQQSKAVEARYMGERAAEQELRDHFKTLELAQAFALYARMRKNIEIAGRILNERSNVPEIQYCKTCGLTMEDYQKRTRKNDWFLNRPHYHEGDRNIIDVDHFCSAACVSYENNKTQGVYGISDQGMTQDMNPKNHPHRRG